MLLHINSTITNINEVVRDFAGKIISAHHGRELFAGKLNQAAHSYYVHFSNTANSRLSGAARVAL